MGKTWRHRIMSFKIFVTIGGSIFQRKKHAYAINIKNVCSVLKKIQFHKFQEEYKIIINKRETIHFFKFQVAMDCFQCGQFCFNLLQKFEQLHCIHLPCSNVAVNQKRKLQFIKFTTNDIVIQLCKMYQTMKHKHQNRQIIGISIRM